MALSTPSTFLFRHTATNTHTGGMIQMSEVDIYMHTVHINHVTVLTLSVSFTDTFTKTL